MRYTVRTITPLDEIPGVITLDEAKAHLGQHLEDDDDLIAALLVAAQDHVEQLTGQVLTLDGEEVRIVALPGHTPGSTAYLWKDLLFSGDALLGRGADEVALAPWFFSESQDQARESLERLAELPFTRMADGHVGVTADARFKLLRMLRR